MNQQSKKIFSIAIATLIGLGIIFFAWKGGSLTKAPLSFKKEDSSWKEALNVVPQASPTRTPGLSSWQKEQDAIVSGPATTTTDVLARALISNFAMNVQRTGTTTLSDTDAAAQAQLLLQEMDVPQGPRYQLANLNITSANDRTTVLAYASATTKIINAFVAVQTVSDLKVVFGDPTEDVTKRLTQFSKNVAHYETLKQNLLVLKVPSSIAPLHLRLIQNYSDMQNGLKLMGDVYNDPMRGLAGLKQYQNAVTSLFTLQQDYQGFVPNN